MKKLSQYIIIGISLFFTVFYAIPAVVLQIPSVQEEVASQVTGFLKKKIGTEVYIDKIELGLYNQLILKNVYLCDQQGDTVLTAKRIGAGFDVLPLFRKKIRINSVQLFTFSCRLSRPNANAPLNIQYIIDAFTKKDSSEPPAIDLRIKQINLWNGEFSYRVQNRRPTPGTFNSGDLKIRDFSAKIELNKLTANQFEAAVNQLRLQEQSGLNVENLSFAISGDSTQFSIPHLNLKLPSSDLNIKDISFQFRPFEFYASIEDSPVCPQDLTCVLTMFDSYKDQITIKGKIAGTDKDLEISDFYLYNKQGILFEAAGKIQNLAGSADEMYAEGYVRRSYFSAEAIQQIFENLHFQTAIPSFVRNLEDVKFNGEISGYLNHLVAHGYFSTGIGNLRTNLIIGKDSKQFVRGQVSTSGLNLQQLMNNNQLGYAAFTLDIDAQFSELKQIYGHVKADIASFEYNRYNYENVRFNGDFTSSSFKGAVQMDNPNGQVAAQGEFTLKGAQSTCDFSIGVNNLLLDQLNLTSKYDHPSLSFSAEAHLTGNNLDNLLGNIDLSSISFSTGQGEYVLDRFQLQSTRQDSLKMIRWDSKLLNGEICGHYYFPALISELKQTFTAYLPSLFAPLPLTKKIDSSVETFDFHCTFNNNENLAELLKLPVVFYRPAIFSGSYKSWSNYLSVNADLPDMKAAGMHIQSATMQWNTTEDHTQLSFFGQMLQKKYTLDFHTSFLAQDDEIHSAITWENEMKKQHKGELQFDTHLSRDDAQALLADITICPSQLTFNDTTWTLDPAAIHIAPDWITVNHLKIQHEKQAVEINGGISQQADTQLRVDLSQVDLAYVFRALNIEALQFGGIANGQVFAKDLFHTRQLTTNLDVTDFAFNNTIFGHLKLDGLWDDENQGVKMLGTIDQKSDPVCHVNGMIYPVKEELSIDFNATRIDISFLRKYVGAIVDNLSGQAAGHIRLFGDLNNPTVEGEVDVTGGRFGIPFLNTYYTFSDHVTCLPDKISISDITLYDDHRNEAKVSGFVNHHLFSDFYYEIQAVYENLMVFNATKAMNPAFYGTAYGTGHASIKGTEKNVNIDVTMQNTDHSKITLNFMNGQDIEEYDFIRFVNKAKERTPASPTYLPLISEQTPIYIQTDSETNINMKLGLTVNPEATIELIMDPISGDKISGNGNGTIDILYGTNTPLSMRGNYQIVKGKYNFSLQQFLFRDFAIKEGSMINFRGDPYTAELDVRAAYQISANLGDLSQQLLYFSTRNNVPVDCILLLEGALNHPNISFDLNLPNASEELTRQVKSYIPTDDLMNREILYLLVLGRFFPTPQYAENEGKVNNDLAFVTSTLSSQLSGILNGISDKLQVGTNFHQSSDEGGTSTEVEILLSSTLLNDRLVLNGNFGYVSNPYQTMMNNSPVVGDFDVEYKLTKSGDIRLKAFNRYNYRTFYSENPEMTQGIGILFRKDFDWIPFFRRKQQKEVLEQKIEETKD
ncbi:MAG: translocation/assembly module TamB domain-containing protein [Dysgonamonadaceae bacterium]|jgi:hypothetical protein|nr:translocation/assembly module TamB domain-containing protein [Dysgonamonadaceae bacterium]